MQLLNKYKAKCLGAHACHPHTWETSLGDIVSLRLSLDYVRPCLNTKQKQKLAQSKTKPSVQCDTMRESWL